MSAAADDAPEILLRHHIKKLKLPMILREHEKIARQCAAEGLDHVRYLARLIELELLDRFVGRSFHWKARFPSSPRMIDRRIKAAKFPALKTLESFDFDALPGLNRKLVLDLARGEFVARRENIIALGPSGTGIGLAACQRGIKTRFATAAAFAIGLEPMAHQWLIPRDDRGSGREAPAPLPAPRRTASSHSPSPVPSCCSS